jgi:hypothetical protein
MALNMSGGSSIVGTAQASHGPTAAEERAGVPVMRTYFSLLAAKVSGNSLANKSG